MAENLRYEIKYNSVDPFTTGRAVQLVPNGATGTVNLYQDLMASTPLQMIEVVSVTVNKIQMWFGEAHTDQGTAVSVSFTFDTTAETQRYVVGAVNDPEKAPDQTGVWGADSGF